MNQLTCHIQQTNCGRTAGEPVCSKCGIDERVRYTTEEAVQFAKDKATAKYRQNEAIDAERLATQAEIELVKSEEARVQARTEKQEAEAEAEDMEEVKLKGVFFVSELYLCFLPYLALALFFDRILSKSLGFSILQISPPSDKLGAVLLIIAVCAPFLIYVLSIQENKSIDGDEKKYIIFSAINALVMLNIIYVLYEPNNIVRFLYWIGFLSVGFVLIFLMQKSLSGHYFSNISKGLSFISPP